MNPRRFWHEDNTTTFTIGFKVAFAFFAGRVVVDFHPCASRFRDLLSASRLFNTSKFYSSFRGLRTHRSCFVRQLFSASAPRLRRLRFAIGNRCSYLVVFARSARCRFRGNSWSFARAATLGCVGFGFAARAGSTATDALRFIHSSFFASQPRTSFGLTSTRICVRAFCDVLSRFF